MNIIFMAINLAFALLIAPIVDGLERKIRARLQNRQGPSILQTWWDLIKLFKRPTVEPQDSVKSLYKLAPYVTFTAVLIAYLIVPTLLPSSINFIGDFIVVVYLLGLATLSFVIGAFSSGNPYAQIGSNREVSLFMSEELLLAFIVGTIAVIGKSLSFDQLFPLPLRISSVLALLLLLLVIYVASARLPFDIAEAEPEIIEGPLIEYSGKHLGLLEYSIFLKRLLLYSLLLNFILPIQNPTRLIGYLLGIMILSMIYSTFEAYYGRFRIDQAVKLMKKLSALALIVWIIAVVGW
ncbi:respiratory chain complex I subunit 1 family protein [Thermococcus barophilus]|uniref:Membrane bound subgroup 4b [NiFe]-hydrogenase MBH(B)2, subunit Mbh(B)2M n=1 Tax=Thermococcus barophilus TaxID=55802 RepID=A0A0S1XBV8_THEBA|nr:NADH-quinone oxidoreductase subunit H [Thermococcus barophilus]ALM75285.1 Membrane bound subgroup 4b [NiFe]-hydrogenase MBH(b)2, subunit Mbh(b)2M [Thermococcus barophilus]